MCQLPIIYQFRNIKIHHLVQTPTASLGQRNESRAEKAVQFLCMNILRMRQSCLYNVHCN